MTSLEKLRRINFHELIQADEKVAAGFQYSYADYSKNGCDNSKILSHPCNECAEMKNGMLLFGTHTEDYLSYLADKPDTGNWNKKGVMFLLENPGKDHANNTNGYVEDAFTKKWFARSWPFIGWERKHEIFVPESKVFSQKYHLANRREYGNMVLALILLFELENAYLTNAVKCSSNGQNTGTLRDETKDRCIHKFLQREIEAMEPAVIVAFGGKTKKLACEVAGEIPVVSVFHPAARKNRVSDEAFFQSRTFYLLDKFIEAGVIGGDRKSFYLKKIQNLKDMI